MNRLTSFLIRQIWPPVSQRRLGERIAPYLQREVLPQLDWGEQEIKIESAESGVNTLLRRWIGTPEGTLYVRAWPWNPRSHPAREHATISGLFRQAGLSVPRVLFADQSFRTMRRWRLECVIETAATGENFDPRRTEHHALLDDLASQTARLHGQTGPAWGKPWRTENEGSDPRAYWRGRLEKFRERLPSHLVRLSPVEFDAALANLETGLGAIQLQVPVLLHGEIRSKHLFVAPDGKITWIDFGTAQYGLPEQDLASARALFSGETYENFLRAYLRHARPDRPMDRGAIDTFSLLRTWERFHSRIRHRQSRLQRGETTGIEKLEADQKLIEEQLGRSLADR